MAEWTNAALNEPKLRRHAIDEARINQEIATPEQSKRNPGRATRRGLRRRGVDANPHIANAGSGTAGS